MRQHNQQNYQNICCKICCSNLGRSNGSISYPKHPDQLQCPPSLQLQLFLWQYFGQCRQPAHSHLSRVVFLNRKAGVQYQALASIIQGHQKPEETTIRYKIALVQLITNLNVILYLSPSHVVYISVLIIFMIMP